MSLPTALFGAIRPGAKAMESKRAKRRKFKAGLARGYKKGFADGALSMLRQFLKPGDLVYDCGANVGAVTEILAPSGATIICYEPDPLCIDILNKKFSATRNVEIRPQAVHTSDGSMQFFRHKNFANRPDSTTASTMIVGNGSVDYTKSAFVAPLIDLPAHLEQTIADQGEIAVLKLDIEGAELDLIEALIERDIFSHIRVSLIETHEVQFPELLARTLALKERIADLYPVHKVCMDWP